MIDPGHWGMVRDILKFHKLAGQASDPNETVSEFVQRNGLGKRFESSFLLPLGSALWSCSIERFGSFPMEFLTDFLSNHKMLQAYNRPVWRVLGVVHVPMSTRSWQGLRSVVSIHSSAVSTATKNGIIIVLPDGSEQSFDQVILACHADQSLKLLDGAEREEIELLQNFPYETNQVSLHSDDRLLPRRASARASWNAYIFKEEKDHAVVTYDMNILQSLPTKEPFCVSLNQQGNIDSSLKHGHYTFEHPTYHPRTKIRTGHAPLLHTKKRNFPMRSLLGIWLS